MKKSVLYLFVLFLAVGLVSSCEKDDTDFSSYTLAGNGSEEDPEDDPDTGDSAKTSSDTIYIAYQDGSATVTGADVTEYTVSGADVIISSTSDDYQVYVLSGTTADGSLLVWREKKFAIVLNNVSITNPDGPAINNQCGKSLYVECPAGTVNTLTDGTDYTARDYDQKGALFSEGQIYFRGAGTLTVNGNYKNAIASDDYITIEDDIVMNVSSTNGNGVKANDGVFIQGGTLTVDVSADGAKGIKSEARTEITGGTTTITTTGDCKIETVDGVADTTSCACIKSDSLFVMTGGTLTMTSKGDGGKGLNCAQNIEFSGGVLKATTTGDNEEGKPKAIKSDTGIIVSGGSFTATVKKSWACDNGTDSEDPASRVTVNGSPTTKTLTKKSVVIAY